MSTSQVIHTIQSSGFLKIPKTTGKSEYMVFHFQDIILPPLLPDAHPALKAVSPQAPMSDEFIGDDCYHNGAFFLMDNFGFYSGFDGPKSANGENYKPFFKVNYNDSYQFFLDFGPLKKANSGSLFF